MDFRGPLIIVVSGAGKFHTLHRDLPRSRHPLDRADDGETEMANPYTQRSWSDRSIDPKAETLPFTAWELSTIELALRYYAQEYGFNSELVRRHVRNLADRIGDANASETKGENR